MGVGIASKSGQAYRLYRMATTFANKLDSTLRSHKAISRQRVRYRNTAENRSNDIRRSAAERSSETADAKRQQKNEGLLQEPTVESRKVVSTSQIRQKSAQLATKSRTLDMQEHNCKNCHNMHVSSQHGVACCVAKISTGI